MKETEQDILKQIFSNNRIRDQFKDIIMKWCSVCEGFYIECPRCGNNSCKGTYGEDGKCPVCPSTYDLTTYISKRHDILESLKCPVT